MLLWRGVCKGLLVWPCQLREVGSGFAGDVSLRDWNGCVSIHKSLCNIKVAGELERHRRSALTVLQDLFVLVMISSGL